MVNDIETLVHPSASRNEQLDRSTDRFDQQIIASRQTARRRDSILSFALGLVFLIGFLGTWYVVQATGLVKPLFISDPLSVFVALFALLGQMSTWQNIGASFIAAILGLVIGSILGIASGVLFARVPVFYRAMRPYLTIFNAFPRPAFAPIFILWFGLGAMPKIAVAVTIVYFVLVLNTMAGIRSVNADIRFLARSLRMSRLQLFFLVELPHAAPPIVAGLRLGAVYSVLGVVVSEIVAANEGLGQLLVKFTNQFAIAESFATLILMAGLAIVLDFAVSILQRRMTWGKGSEAEH